MARNIQTPGETTELTQAVADSITVVDDQGETTELTVITSEQAEEIIQRLARIEAKLSNLSVGAGQSFEVKAPTFRLDPKRGYVQE